MTWAFFSYFMSYILKARTRQRLLFIAVSGLFLSSFSLLVIQGIMGGLQHNLVKRSKDIHGSYLIQFSDVTDESLSELKELLRKEGIPFYSELEVEVMLKQRNFVSPAKLHGIDLSDERPPFLAEKDFKGVVMGSELASRIKLQFLDSVQIIAPGVTDSVMGEVPRFVTETFTDFLYTEQTEVDSFESWARLSLVQNLIRRPGINQIRLFGAIRPELLAQIEAIPTEVSRKMVSWETMNEALVWSLNLETKVMLFLFISMGFLVAIAITSGLMIFYSKIRKDLMSFWILGMGQDRLLRLCFRFTLILSGITIISGGIAGQLTLRLLENFGHRLMPEIFIERQLPVQLNLGHVVISTLIPFGISLIFSYFSFANFRKENQSFVSVVRSLT
jgi:lipoprotein-releasing system permease protein